MARPKIRINTFNDIASPNAAPMLEREPTSSKSSTQLLGQPCTPPSSYMFVHLFKLLIQYPPLFHALVKVITHCGAGQNVETCTCRFTTKIKTSQARFGYAWTLPHCDCGASKLSRAQQVHENIPVGLGLAAWILEFPKSFVCVLAKICLLYHTLHHKLLEVRHSHWLRKVELFHEALPVYCNLDWFCWRRWVNHEFEILKKKEQVVNWLPSCNIQPVARMWQPMLRSVHNLCSDWVVCSFQDVDDLLHDAFVITLAKPPHILQDGDSRPFGHNVLQGMQDPRKPNSP